MKRLIGKFPDVTAVFAMSDVMAIGAIRALRDLGYRVPEDVSVIGFDGTSLAEYYNPKLATIKQQHQTLAKPQHRDFIRPDRVEERADSRGCSV